MKVVRGRDMESGRGPEKRFRGMVWVDVMLDPQQRTGLGVYRVFFAPGARTHWHAHPGEQALYVVAGNGRVKKSSEQGIEIGPGDIVHITPGEKHWHGAGPASFMMHIAVTTGGPADWLDQVTQEEYSRDFD